MSNATYRDHGKVRTATSLKQLKAAAGAPPRGYRFWHRPLRAVETTIDVYVVPDSSAASSPELLPEGARHVGMVIYASYEDGLRDLR